MKRKPSGPGYWLLIPAALISIGIAVLGHTAMIHWEIRQSRNWPSVAGTVISSREVKNLRYTWVPVIHYGYRVNQHEFSDSTYSLGYGGFCPIESYRIVNSHPPGSLVQVYYDPAHPGNACLLPGIGAWNNNGFIGPVILGFVLLLMGATVSKMMLRRGTPLKIPDPDPDHRGFYDGL